MAVCPLTAIQSEYHLMHRDVETNGVLDVCRELGIGFVPYSPINRGFLGGCINEYTVFDPTNDNRQTLPRFQPEAIRANMRIVNVLQQFGRTYGMTSAQVALGWLLQKAPVDRTDSRNDQTLAFGRKSAHARFQPLRRRVAQTRNGCRSYSCRR